MTDFWTDCKLVTGNRSTEVIIASSHIVKPNFCIVKVIVSINKVCIVSPESGT